MVLSLRLASVVALGLLMPGASYGQSPRRSFQPLELRHDLDRLEKALRTMHPAMFMYATPERFERCFDSLRAVVRHPLTEQEFLSAIASLYPLLGDGHTLFLPSRADAAHENRYIPLRLHWADDRLRIVENGSNDDRLFPGAEIIAINGVPSAAVMDTLLMRQIRDGHNSTYPIWILNNYFKAYYRFSFGEPDSFRLQVRSSGGDELIVVQALTADSIRANVTRQALEAHQPEERAFGLHYELDSIAVLTIPSFERGSLTAEGLDRVFEELRARRTRRLIIDLRGNQGGEPKLAKRLLAHLLNGPFTLVRKGPTSGEAKPRSPVFGGDLVALMDGGSFSATGMVLSCLERHGRATFIGEEAGGNRTVLSGSPKRIVLPRTRIECHISTRLWQLVDGPNDGHGVMPTIAIHPRIEDLITGRDPVMEAALDSLLPR